MVTYNIGSPNSKTVATSLASAKKMALERLEKGSKTSTYRYWGTTHRGIPVYKNGDEVGWVEKETYNYGKSKRYVWNEYFTVTENNIDKYDHLYIGFRENNGSTVLKEIKK